jgi:5-methylcytosine-specific restriction endonuclease McrA
MPRRPVQTTPETIRAELVDLLSEFERYLEHSDLREKVLALIPAFHLLRDLGSSLTPYQESTAARDRILAYFRKYPSTVIHGDELMVVSGIQDWPRRTRELRCEYGWAIASGVTIQGMSDENEVDLRPLGVEALRPEEYILLDSEQDREAALRWRLANDIRRKSSGVRSKMLEFLRTNVRHVVTGEELRYVANGRTEWARRIRELRTEKGWPIATRNTGRPDLAIGVYVLEQDRQSPSHDRSIPDPVRRSVLVRDSYACRNCGWTHTQWNPSDPRHLELHHIRPHAEGGENLEANLSTLCTVCHDDIHREK